MLNCIDKLYTEQDSSNTPEQQLTDMIGYLQQMLDGGHLSPLHIARIQQLGISALQHEQEE